MSILRRVSSLLRSRQLEQELEDELRSHLEMRTEENLESGMSEQEARREAAMRFGNKLSARENTRSVYMVAWLESVLQDLRYGFRTMRRSPAFSLVAVVTVALTIGMTTAVFTVVNSVLLRPLPYAAPSQLIWAATLDPRGHQPGTPGPDVAAWLKQNTTLKAMAGYTEDDYNLSGAGDPIRVPGALVTAGFFRTLGAEPRLGRSFLNTEDRPNGDRVVILTDQFWRDHFSADPGVLGRKVEIEGQPYIIVGVMPPQFRFPDNGMEPSLLLPLQFNLSAVDRIMILNAIGRLKDGVTPQQAYTDLNQIAQKTFNQYPAGIQNFVRGRTIQVSDLRAVLVGDVRKPLLVILAAVSFVLLIGCLNITSLQLARAVERTAEMEMRSALGAKRGRITRQLLTENALLYFIGAGLGIAVASVAVAAARAATTKVLPTVSTISMDHRALLFTALVTFFCAALFGLAPALSLNKARLVHQPAEGRLTTSRTNRRLRKLLLVTEVALALVLLTGAGLMIHSFDRLMRVNPGFNPSHLLTARVTLVDTDFPKVEQQVEFFDTLLPRLRALPGVEHAALTNEIPLQGEGVVTYARMEGEPVPPNLTIAMAPLVGLSAVSPDYFRTLQTPILQGRSFTESDTQTSVPVAIVNQAFVTNFLHGEDPLNKRIIGSGSGNSRLLTIVGVAADIHHSGLEQNVRAQIYRPFDQPSLISTYRMALLLRSRTDPATLAAAVRREVAALHGGQPVFDVATMNQLLRDSLSQRRLSLILVGTFSVLALLLAAVGIYGVTSYSVAQRTHEIGIRMAVGCSPARVLKLVLSESALITLAGLILGLAAALWLSRFITSLLYQTQPNDLPSMLSASTLLVGAGLLAGAIPAYRASKVDPVIALRAE
jgi:putative ABC transport system permease protein